MPGLTVLSKMALDKRQRLQERRNTPTCMPGLTVLSKMALDKRQRLQDGGTHLPVWQDCLFYPRWRWLSASNYKMVEHTYLDAGAVCSIQDGAG
jgi:hypothetical protein